MFRDADQRYIASLVASNRKEYPYYIAFTNYRYSDYNTPALYIYFSKEKIEGVNLYDYKVPRGIQYKIITNGYSGYDSNPPRIVCSNFNGGNYSVPQYEFVYTNAKFTGTSIQPDINLIYGGDYNAQMVVQNWLVTFALLCALIFTILRVRR